MNSIASVVPNVSRKKMIVRRVLTKRATNGAGVTVTVADGNSANVSGHRRTTTNGGQQGGSGKNAPSDHIFSIASMTGSLHRQQSSMAALLSSAHEEVEGGPGMEAQPFSLILRRRDRHGRPPSPASALRRLAILASYSPFAVSLPILMSDAGYATADRFRESSRSFWGVVMFCDISGFTKLAEALALGNEPNAAAAAAAATSSTSSSSSSTSHHPPRYPHNSSNTNNSSNNHSHPYGANTPAQTAAGASTAAAPAPSGDHRRWLQRAGADTLVTIINQIFHRIISIIISHHGDVIKFAGDALLSVWRPDSNDSDGDGRTKCALAAAKAALEISAAMANFEAHGVKMSVHSGLACGQLVELHLGGFKNRWEYLIAGQPILAMGRALDASTEGDVVAHGSVWDLIHEHATGVMIEQATTSNGVHSSSSSSPSASASPSSSASVSTSTSTSASASSSTTNSYHPAASPKLVAVTIHHSREHSSNHASANSTAPLTRLIAVHVAPPLSMNLLDNLTLFCPFKRERAEDALASYIPEPAMTLMQTGKELVTGELRQVTILFILLPDFDYTTVDALRRNHAAVVIVQQVLYRFDGVMRQLIQDDKGQTRIKDMLHQFASHPLLTPPSSPAQ